MGKIKKRPPRRAAKTKGSASSKHTRAAPEIAKRTKQDNSSDSLRADLLWGCAAIAAEIGRDPRATFYMLQNGSIPASKVGQIWTSTRSRLRRHFEGEAA